MGKVHFVEEKVSGTVPWKKRKIAKVIEELTTGDNLLVSELSRIGRSMLEIMQVLQIALEKGINAYAVKGNWQLDNSIQSKIVASRPLRNQFKSTLKRRGVEKVDDDVLKKEIKR